MCRQRQTRYELQGGGRLPDDANSSPGLSSEQVTRTTTSSEWIINRTSLRVPLEGKEQGTVGHTPPANTTRQNRGGD
jgi:hypothetical protein